MRRISPNQSFQVRHQGNLSPMQQAGLVQFYQPLIGVEGVGVYLGLINQPQEKPYWSVRSIHAELLTTLNLGVDQLDDACIKLEGVGLLRTYRETETHPDTSYQTLLYDVSLPLTPRAFLEHALLSTALMSQIGDQSYQQLKQVWTVQELDLQKYVEITQTFEQVFTYQLTDQPSIVVDTLRGDQRAVPSHADESFNYGKFLRYIMAEGINHKQLNQALKEEVLALHSVYDLNEMDITEIVKLSINNTTGQIQLDQLKDLAQRNLYFKSNQQAKQQPASSSMASSFPVAYTKEQLEARKNKIQERYEALGTEDIDLILVTEQIPNENFLIQIQERRGGFATDQERFFVRDLKNKTNLDVPVINYLIYHLLIHQEQKNIFKGPLERIANQWQQAAIETVAQAMIYTRQQAQEKSHSFSDSRRQRQEITPEWFNQQENVEQEKPDPEETKRLQARIDQLYKQQEGDQ